MNEEKYKKWEELTPKEKEAWLHSFPRTYTKNDLRKNDITESDKLIDSCFANCGKEWDSLKKSMKQDDSFKLQRTIEIVDEKGHITEKKEYY